MLILTHGDIMNAKCDAIVNPVNCMGVMGKGVALLMKKKYPGMFKEYQRICREKKFYIGKVEFYQVNSDKNPRYVINFPTKINYWEKSTMAYIHTGLMVMRELIPFYDLTTVAMPAIGCGEGGLEFEGVYKLIDDVLNTPLYDLDRNVKIFVCHPHVR